MNNERPLALTFELVEWPPQWALGKFPALLNQTRGRSRSASQGEKLLVTGQTMMALS